MSTELKTATAITMQQEIEQRVQHWTEFMRAADALRVELEQWLIEEHVSSHESDRLEKCDRRGCQKVQEQLQTYDTARQKVSS